MDDISQRYKQMLYERDYPVPPQTPAPKRPGEANIGTATMDTLAGVIKGSVAATAGLPGDLRELVNLIAEETATKILGKRWVPTTEEMQAALPPVVKPPADPGDPAHLDRSNRVALAEVVGEFLPLAPVAAAVKVAKAVGKKRAAQAAAGTATAAASEPAGDRVIRYDTEGKRK
jgi:hypothetical protein